MPKGLQQPHVMHARICRPLAAYMALGVKQGCPADSGFAWTWHCCCNLFHLSGCMMLCFLLDLHIIYHHHHVKGQPGSWHDSGTLRRTTPVQHFLVAVLVTPSLVLSSMWFLLAGPSSPGGKSFQPNPTGDQRDVHLRPGMQLYGAAYVLRLGSKLL